MGRDRWIEASVSQPWLQRFLGEEATGYSKSEPGGGARGLRSEQGTIDRRTGVEIEPPLRGGSRVSGST